MTRSVAEDVNHIFILDGDVKPDNDLDSDVSSLGVTALQARLEDVLKGSFTSPLPSNPTDEEKLRVYTLMYKFCQTNLTYIPEKTPEEFIWKNMSKKSEIEWEIFEAESCYKAKFKELARMEYGYPEGQYPNSDEIFGVQKMALGSIDIRKLNGLARWIKGRLD